MCDTKVDLSLSVETQIADYLRSLNPLAVRVAEDIDKVRHAYSQLWFNMDRKQKNQVIDEALIQPDAILKYSNMMYKEVKLEPLSTFSWFTKSQVDLFEHLNLKQKPVKHDAPETGKRSKRPAPPPPVVPPNGRKHLDFTIKSPPTEPNNMFSRFKNRLVVNKAGPGEDKLCLVDGGKGIVIPSGKGGVTKPKNPPPPPPAQMVPSASSTSESRALLTSGASDDSSLSNSIPMSGFDFLDNW